MRAVTTLQDTTTVVWPGTGQSWWWEHLLHDGVTHFLLPLHIVIYDLKSDFTGVYLNPGHLLEKYTTKNDIVDKVKK